MLLLVLFCFLSVPALSQQATALSQDDLIKQALADLTPVAGKTVTPLSFSRMVMVAVALEQTHAWKTPTADRLRQLLPDAPSKQCFAAVQQLIADGDTAGAVALQSQVRAGSIPPADLAAGMQLLQQAGLKLASDALLVTTSGDPQELITALLRVPVEQRFPLEAYLYDRNNPANNPLNYMKLTGAALGIYNKTPVTDKATCDGLLRLVNLFGIGSSQFNMTTFSRMYSSGNASGAMYMLQWLLARYPDDTTLQADAFQAIMFGGLGGTRQDQLTMIRSMMDTLKPHYARRFRRDYYNQISLNPKVAESISLAVLQKDPDKLIAAESNLALQQIADASALYARILADLHEPLSRRLAAWSGLWDADPDKAVAATPLLTDEILKLPPSAERTATIRWFGGEMGRVAPFITNGWTSKRPKATQPVCFSTMAASMTRLVTADPLACLRLENANGKSLRYSAAIIYLMAKMGKEANDVVVQVVEYKECPRPGTRFASTTTKLQQEIGFTSPRLGETEEVVDKLVKAMVSYDKSFGKANTTMITPEPPNGKVIPQLCAHLAVCTNPNEIKEELRRLGEQLTFAVTYLDPKPEGLSTNAPPPAPRAVKMEYIAPLMDSIDKVFDNQLACKNSDLFIAAGLQKSMLTASNPDLLEGLFNLSIKVIDKCIAVSGKDNTFKGSITNYANYIEGRQIWNLKPYADKLRAKYLLSEEKKEE
ncbi:MAG: hypothetical protein ACYDBB_02295 [Armatimonadota bacterium]